MSRHRQADYLPGTGFSFDADHLDRERQKARELKRSAWWKNRIGVGTCAYCGSQTHPSQLTLDHVVPLIHGGKTSKSNCVPACMACNQRKSNTPAETWKVQIEEEKESG
ncbi:MAG: HNH endonuclease [Magnetococcus sp. DMHC-6]